VKNEQVGEAESRSLSAGKTLLGLLIPGLFDGGIRTSRLISIPIVSIAIILLGFLGFLFVFGVIAELFFK